MSKPRQPKSRSSKSRRVERRPSTATPRPSFGFEAPAVRELRVGSGGLIVLRESHPMRMVPAWVEILEVAGAEVRVGLVARRIKDDGSLGYAHADEGFIEERLVTAREVLPVSDQEIEDARVGHIHDLIDLRLGRAFDHHRDRFVVVDASDEVPAGAAEFARFLIGSGLFR